MRLLLWISALAFVAGYAAFDAPATLAQSNTPKVVQTGCDTLSLNPPIVRVRFGVINLGDIPVCSLHLRPVQSGPTPADSCRIFECSSPPGWVCELDPAVGGAHWRVIPGAACIGKGEKHEEFDIILDPLFCCYEASFDDGDGTVFFRDTICFECEKPVPAGTTTWGRLKTLYR